MKKPNETLLKLADLGTIHGIYVKQKQTGTDTADTFVKLTGSNGIMNALWSTVRDFLHVSVSYDSIAEINRDDTIKVKEWRDYEQTNKDEYKEYRRLKAKFDS